MQRERDPIELCAKFASFTGPKREIMDVLIEYERQEPLNQHAWMRVWGLGSAIERIARMRRLRTWADVEALRASFPG